MADLFERLTASLDGRYRLEHELGRGGMATVFLAEDIKHHRQVAIKVLDPQIASVIGPDRFLREIETVAKLAHPHILPLHDSGVADGLLFYVMPYVEGKSLRDRLTREKQLPVSDALRIAREAADALSYAHAHGLVHRDVKPENLLLEEGHAVVADFGVARAIAVSDPKAMTSTGIVVGTAAYMSPEQAAGSRDLDGRSDLYALGCVLYEMLAGVPPFSGPTAESLVHQHMNVTPRPVTELRPAVPAGVAAALQRALAKVPGDRFNPVALFGEALIERDMSHPAIARRRWPQWMWAVGVGVAAILVAIATMVWSRSGKVPQAPQVEDHQLTDEGNVVQSALSPDGEYLAYVVRKREPWATLKVMDLKGRTPLVVADSVRSFAGGMSWSPDGTRLGFAGQIRDQAALFIFPRLGGMPERRPYSPFFAWSPDGTRMALWWTPTEQKLKILDLRSGETDSLSIPGTDKFVHSGEWSPHGDRLALATLVQTASSHLWILDLAKRSYTMVLADSANLGDPHWTPRGESIYYLRNDDLYCVSVDQRTGQKIGQGRRVRSLKDGSGKCTYSSDGRKLVYTRLSGYQNFSIARAGAGGKLEWLKLTTGTANKKFPALSPDGTDLAFLQQGEEGWDLFRVSTGGGTPERLTFGGMAESVRPAWDPTGKRLAFASKVGTEIHLALIAANGGSVQVFRRTSVSQEISWAPGSRIAYQLPGNRNYALFDPTSEGERPLVQNDSVGWIFAPQFSPDGNRVAVFWNRVARGPNGIKKERGLWLISLEDGSQVQLSDVWFPIEWSRDGRSLYAGTLDGRFVRAPVAGGPGVALASPAHEDAECAPFERPNGLVWVCAETKSWSDAWMIDNFDPGLVAGKLP